VSNDFELLAFPSWPGMDPTILFCRRACEKDARVEPAHDDVAMKKRKRATHCL